MDGGRRKLAAEIVLFMECVLDVNCCFALMEKPIYRL